MVYADITGTTKIQKSLCSIHCSVSTDGATQAALDHFAVTFPSTKISGNLHCLFYPFLVKGVVQGASQDISPFARFFRKNIHGKTNATLTLNAVDLQQSMRLNVDCTHLRSPTFHFQDMHVELTGKGLLPAPQVALSVTSTKGQWKHFEFTNSTVAAAVDFAAVKPALHFELKSDGKVDRGPFSIDTKGSIGPDRITAERFFLSLDKTHAKLTTPFLLKKEQGIVTLAPFELLWNTGAKISGQALLGTNMLQGELHATAVPLDFVHFLFPTAFVSGNFSAEGSLAGTKTAPRIHLEIGSEALTFGTKQQDLFIPLVACLNIDIDDNMACCHAEMTTTGAEHPLVIHAQIPVTFQKDAKKLEFPTLGHLSGNIEGGIEIAPFLSPFLLDDEIIEGALKMNVAVSGTCYKPKFAGTLTWSGGKLDLLKTGRTLSDIHGQGQFKNGEFIMDTISATDEREGSVKGSGRMQLNYEKGFPFVLDISTHKLDFIRRDFATVCGSGTARVSGNLEGASITGDVVMDLAELNLTSDLGSDLASDFASIEYIYINHPEQPLKAVVKPFIVGFNLNIVLPPNSGTIVGRGLKSSWEGNLKISGTSEVPLVHGEIRATKGVFSFAEKEFALTQGTIECEGDLLTKSRLNIAASLDLGELRAKLFVRGSLDKPRLYIESAPQMAQKEILAWILFNKPLAEISPVEGLQLANVIMSINTSGKNISVIEKFKKALGIDHIDISHNDGTDSNSEEVTVQVGKYVSKDVFVKLSKDVAKATNRVAVQAHLHKNVSVQAEVGDDQEGQMSVMWKYDY